VETELASSLSDVDKLTKIVSVDPLPESVDKVLKDLLSKMNSEVLAKVMAAVLKDKDPLASKYLDQKALMGLSTEEKKRIMKEVLKKDDDSAVNAINDGYNSAQVLTEEVAKKYKESMVTEGQSPQVTKALEIQNTPELTKMNKVIKDKELKPH